MNRKLFLFRKSEALIGGTFGGIIGYIMFYIVYRQAIISAIGLIIGGFCGVLVYKKIRYQQFQKQLISEFKIMVDSLNSSYTAGKNTRQSIEHIPADCYRYYREKSILYREFQYIIGQLNNGFSFEQQLNELGNRINMKEFNRFILIFVNTYRTGGNLKELMSATRRVLYRKIEVEESVATIIYEQKRQIYILFFIPYVLLILFDGFGFANTVDYTKLVFIRTVALLLFGFGYLWAKSIIRKLEKML